MGPASTPLTGEPAPSHLIAGFDAGQTHTTCQLAVRQPDGQLRVVACGQGSGVSHLAAPGGRERFQTALRSALAACRASADPEQRGPLAAAGVGASGMEAGTPLIEEGRQLAALALDLPAHRVMVSGDERTALRGAFPDGPGILLISGTGCIAIGRDSHGREHRCGGWGWLLDGAGSAMDIGRDALMLSVRMADGRRRDGALRQRLWDALGVHSSQELKALVVQAEFGPAGFAGLAPSVNELALAGDLDASRIIARSAEELAQLVKGVADHLNLRAPQVAAVGGAIAHLLALKTRFREALAEEFPQARMVTPQNDACHGALLLASTQLDPLRNTVQP
jgi:phenylacetic acid degradation operon negative regulatory protein